MTILDEDFMRHALGLEDLIDRPEYATAAQRALGRFSAQQLDQRPMFRGRIDVNDALRDSFESMYPSPFASPQATPIDAVGLPSLFTATPLRNASSVKASRSGVSAGALIRKKFGS